MGRVLPTSQVGKTLSTIRMSENHSEEVNRYAVELVW
jgi:hypothetical protein